MGGLDAPVAAIENEEASRAGGVGAAPLDNEWEEIAGVLLGAADT